MSGTFCRRSCGSVRSGGLLLGGSQGRGGSGVLLRDQSCRGNGGHIEEHFIHIFLYHVNGFGSGFVLIVVKKLHHRDVAFKMSGRLRRLTVIRNADGHLVITFTDRSVAVRNLIMCFGNGLPIAVGRNAAVDNISADKYSGKHRQKHRHDNHEFLSNRFVQRSPSLLISMSHYHHNRQGTP